MNNVNRKSAVLASAFNPQQHVIDAFCRALMDALQVPTAQKAAAPACPFIIQAKWNGKDIQGKRIADLPANEYDRRSERAIGFISDLAFALKGKYIEKDIYGFHSEAQAAKFVTAASILPCVSNVGPKGLYSQD